MHDITQGKHRKADHLPLPGITPHRSTCRSWSSDGKVTISRKSSRFSYELLQEGGKDADGVSWDHPLLGYLFPLAADGAARTDQVQERAIDGVIAFLDRYMKPGR